MKTPEKLLDIYINSVGKNSVLLLNVPPDRSARIHSADSAGLIGFARLKDKVFEKDLFKGATIRAHRSDTTLVQTYYLKESVTVNLLQVKERIASGQRVEQFQLSYLRNGEWVVAASATTVGYMRILQFEPIISTAFKLSFVGRGKINLLTVGIFMYKGSSGEGVRLP